MRKNTALGFAICGTLLLLLLAFFGRMIYINIHVQTFDQIAGRGIHHTLQLTENETSLLDVTEERRISEYVDLLDDYTYTEYPHLFQPQEEKLSANRLTVTFENGNSIGVDADGYIFVNGDLHGIEGDRGQELYHKLYLLFYPNAAANNK